MKINPLLLRMQHAKKPIQTAVDQTSGGVIESTASPPPPSTVDLQLPAESSVEVASNSSGEAIEPVSVPLPSMAAMIHAKQSAEVADHMVGSGETQIEAVKSPQDFKAMLDKMDSLMAEGMGSDGMTIDIVRAYVKRIMIDLKQIPELDAVLIDRDVHNILAFIRTVKDIATVKQEKVTQKKAVKAGKGGLSGMKFDLTSLPMGLSDLGKVKT